MKRICGVDPRLVGVLGIPQRPRAAQPAGVRLGVVLLVEDVGLRVVVHVEVVDRALPGGVVVRASDRRGTTTGSRRRRRRRVRARCSSSRTSSTPPAPAARRRASRRARPRRSAGTCRGSPRTSGTSGGRRSGCGPTDRARCPSRCTAATAPAAAIRCSHAATLSGVLSTLARGRVGLDLRIVAVADLRRRRGTAAVLGERAVVVVVVLGHPPERRDRHPGLDAGRVVVDCT